MSRLSGDPLIRLHSNLVWPLAVAGIAGVFLLMADLQPVHYFSAISVSIIVSFFIYGRLQKVDVRSIVKRSLLIVTCLLLLGSVILPARAAIITEYSMFGDPRPRGITVDSGGTVWFTEQLRSSIGYLSGTQVTELRVPTLGSEPWEIVYLPNPATGTSDPNADSIWFTESATGKIGRYKGGVFVEFDLQMGATGSYTSEYPTGLTFDYNATSSVPYRNVWFVETGGNAIGKIYYNATGSLKNRWVVTEYKVPSTLNNPIDIARSPVDGLLFICSLASNNIGSFNPWTKQFRVYSVSASLDDTPGSDSLRAIAIGSDGIVWAVFDYADSSRYDKILRLDPWTGEMASYEIPTQGGGPRDLTVDSDKNVWFTEYDQDKIGRLNPITGYITEYRLPTSGSRPLGIATSGGIVWFTEWENNKIGRLDPASAVVYSTVNTITSATSASTTVGPTTVTRPDTTTSSIVYSTSTTPQNNPTAKFYVTGTSYDGTTMTVNYRFATSTQTANTETVYVLPTSTTMSTTSTFTSTFWRTTTVSPTLTSVISTDISSTTTTTSATFSTPVSTETTYTTRQVVYTEDVATTTETNYAATSYRFTTKTLPTFTQYSTSTLRETTTETVSTVTTVATTFTTSTVFTTVTAGILGPAALAMVLLLALDVTRRRAIGKTRK